MPDTKLNAEQDRISVSLQSSGRNTPLGLQVDGWYQQVKQRPLGTYQWVHLVWGVHSRQRGGRDVKAET